MIFLSTSTEMTPYFLQSSQNRFSPHTFKFITHFCLIISLCPSRSKWPRGLRCGSAAASLLRSWVRIPPEVWNVCLLRVLCVIRYSALRRAHHSSRGVLPNVVCRCVWSRKPREWGGPGPLAGLLHQMENKPIFWVKSTANVNTLMTIQHCTVRKNWWLPSRLDTRTDSVICLM